MCDETYEDWEPVIEPKGIEDVRRVRDEGCAMFKWGKDKVMMDSTTAHMLCTVYDSAKDQTKEAISTAIAKSKGHFCKVVDIGWKCVRS